MTSKARELTGKYYIGLMSGTSADGIDLALVEFSDTQNTSRVVASYYQAYSDLVIEKITSLYLPGQDEIDRGFHLDIELAHLFAQAISALLRQEKLSSDAIIAIGSHGQTIRHRPIGDYPFTLQIGCCQTLATLTAIRVIGQFRRKDMALGGQGAPLVPIFHQQLFGQKNASTFVVNIGGISNNTFLPKQGSSQSVLGFDTGPGNALLDDWYITHHPSSDKFDKNGEWAASGRINHAFLAQLMTDDYIKRDAPKSTGREYFNLDWLSQQLTCFNAKAIKPLSPEDVQATLLAFTSTSISQSIKALAKEGKIYLCGGGVHNKALVVLLNETLPQPYEILSMASLNIDGDILEAHAFAWLAHAYDHNLVSNMPAVTGASSTCTLGTLFLP